MTMLLVFHILDDITLFGLGINKVTALSFNARGQITSEFDHMLLYLLAD